MLTLVNWIYEWPTFFFIWQHFSECLLPKCMESLHPRLFLHSMISALAKWSNMAKSFNGTIATCYLLWNRTTNCRHLSACLFKWTSLLTNISCGKLDLSPDSCHVHLVYLDKRNVVLWDYSLQTTLDSPIRAPINKCTFWLFTCHILWMGWHLPGPFQIKCEFEGSTKYLFKYITLCSANSML